MYPAVKKLHIFVIVLLIFAIIAATFSVFVTIVRNNAPSPAATIDPPIWPDMPANTNPNLKYFGYYHFSEPEAINAVAEMGNANVAKADADCLDEIANLAAKDFKILIMTRHIFFKSGELKPDYQQIWEQTKINIAPYMDNIIGFYVDEPMWTGKSQEAFQTSCQIVRQDFPDKIMMAMVCWFSVITPNLIGYEPDEYFKYCTDLGFDYYHPWDKDYFLYNVNVFKTKVAVHNQKIWLSPKGFYVADHDKSINWLNEDTTLPHGDDIVNWIKGCYEVAVEDHDIVGFFTFVYGSDSEIDSYDHWLAQYFDVDGEFYRKDIRELYIDIGKAIIANDN